jgi:hypothetical protein
VKDAWLGAYATLVGVMNDAARAEPAKKGLLRASGADGAAISTRRSKSLKDSAAHGFRQIDAWPQAVDLPG